MLGGPQLLSEGHSDLGGLGHRGEHGLDHLVGLGVRGHSIFELLRLGVWADNYFSMSV